jgi:hypothetical protein
VWLVPAADVDVLVLSIDGNAIYPLR